MTEGNGADRASSKDRPPLSSPQIGDCEGPEDCEEIFELLASVCGNPSADYDAELCSEEGAEDGWYRIACRECPACLEWMRGLRSKHCVEEVRTAGMCYDDCPLALTESEKQALDKEAGSVSQSEHGSEGEAEAT
jgi:hypothetical protein